MTANELTTVVVPLAELVSLTLVFANVLSIIVVPEALIVSFALVTETVPVVPLLVLLFPKYSLNTVSF